MWVYIHRFDSLSIYTLFLFFESNLKYTIKHTIIYVFRKDYCDILLKNKELWRRDWIAIFVEIYKKTTMLYFVVFRHSINSKEFIIYIYILQHKLLDRVITHNIYALFTYFIRKYIEIIKQNTQLFMCWERITMIYF
jgi:hypothetical protein